MADCLKCRGKGYYFRVLKDISGKRGDGMGIDAFVPCDDFCCNNGKIDPEKVKEYYKQFRNIKEV